MSGQRISRKQWIVAIGLGVVAPLCLPTSAGADSILLQGDLSVSVAAAGEPITASGTNCAVLSAVDGSTEFAATPGEVSLLMDGAIAVFPAGADGSWTYELPSLDPGTHVISATCDTYFGEMSYLPVTLAVAGPTPTSAVEDTTDRSTFDSSATAETSKAGTRTVDTAELAATGADAALLPSIGFGLGLAATGLVLIRWGRRRPLA